MTFRDGGYEYYSYLQGQYFQRLWKRRCAEAVVGALSVFQPFFHIDIGCGSSPIPRMIVERTPASVMGYDVDKDKVEFARHAYPPRDLKYSATWDAVCRFMAANKGWFTASIVEVIEHIEEAEFRDYLLRLREYKARAVVIATPDFSSLQWRIVEYVAKKRLRGSWHDDHQDDYKYDERKLRRVLSEEGWQVVKLRKIFGADMVVTAVRRQ